MFSQDIIDRFWSKVDKTSDPNGHWLWTAGIFSNGYGQFSYRDSQGKQHNVRAHRFAYPLLHEEEIPPDLQVLHKPPCVNRRCVLHTYLGTQKANWDDMRALGRQASGIKNGTHTRPDRTARGERVSLAKLTSEVIEEIRASRGILTQQELANKFGVNRTAIASIQRGKTWRHVPGHALPIPLTNN